MEDKKNFAENSEVQKSDVLSGCGRIMVLGENGMKENPDFLSKMMKKYVERFGN